MINSILEFALRWRVLVFVLAALIVGIGINAATQLPIDAVPDITNVQVQINTAAPALSPEEVEQLITVPLEVMMSGLPRVAETRSLSQFGLSQVTIVFDDAMPLLNARQLVSERIQDALQHLPPDVGHPELAPIATGLGEIYYVILQRDEKAKLAVSVSPRLPVSESQSLMDLRTTLDWAIKPQLRNVRGVIEVNSFGGLEKQYQVLLDPSKLLKHDLTLRQVEEAVIANNRNAGGGYLERGGEQQIVRGVGRIRSLTDIESIVVAAEHGTPIFLREVAEVTLGPAIRQGAFTRDGQGEVVVGIVMMLIGENSRTVVHRVRERVAAIEKSLQREGVKVTSFLDRSELVDNTIRTAVTNLVEGGLLVIVVLFVVLRSFRAALITASAIPLAMLISVTGMERFGISANLMSLGAIDFGLIVDGAVIMVENCVRRLGERRHELGRALTADERLQTVRAGATEVVNPALFGVFIIIAAYVPILTLGGVEGKMFKPMAFTVVFALMGALVLSLTLVPALCAQFLRDAEEEEPRAATRLKQAYARALRWALGHRLATVGGAMSFVVACVALFPLLGSEFLPELDEGAIAIEAMWLPTMSIDEAVRRETQVEGLLRGKFPNEIRLIASRIGRPDIATDPMLTSQHDILIELTPRSRWKAARTKEELVEKMDAELKQVIGCAFGFTQPIKMRMNELVEGVFVRGDAAIKVFGDDVEVLRRTAEQVAELVRSVPGAADVKVEQTSGLPMLEVIVKRDAIARYGLNVDDVQALVETAIGGKEVSEVMETNRRFPLVLRFASSAREDPEVIGNLLVSAPSGARVPLSQLAEIRSGEGPTQIQRENGQRRIVVQANARGRDLGSFVEEAQRRVAPIERALPANYRIEWGGTYEHLVSGRERLNLVVPLTFGLIFLLLFTTFNSLKQATLVFTGIPFAIIGGILALFARDLNFSMSAGIGFIALFGVAVLNGVVMVTFINQLRELGRPVEQAVIEGALTRLRPVLMTAMVASIGFLPMALSHGTGAEVQRPLATVVIGGLMTSTLLTLFVLPTLYAWFERSVEK